MTISFSDRVNVPDDVLISSLDDVGTRFLSVLTTSESIETAYKRLLNEYHVDGDVLRGDLLALVENLINQGILIRSTNS